MITCHVMIFYACSTLNVHVAWSLACETMAMFGSHEVELFGVSWGPNNPWVAKHGGLFGASWN